MVGNSNIFRWAILWNVVVAFFRFVFTIRMTESFDFQTHYRGILARISIYNQSFLSAVSAYIVVLLLNESQSPVETRHFFPEDYALGIS